MKVLSPEVSALLDKLYNLRGDESVILVEMMKQKNKAEETMARTTEEKKELQEKIANLEQLNEALNEQGDKLVSVLSGIDRDEYAIVLDRLKIDFNPHNLVEKINKSLPRTIETVTFDTKKAAEKLLKVEEEMNTAMTTIDEIGIRRDTALANQEKLNEYFELALTGNINITRDSITSLLSQLNFNEEEQREAAKLLMFPEDALLIYDAKLKDKERSGKSISDVIAEAKNADPIVEEAVKIIPEEPQSLEIEETVEEDNTSATKEELLDLLDEQNINYIDFTAQELDLLLAHYSKETILNNIEYIRSLDIDTDMFVNHATLLIDTELEDKMKALLNEGKSVIDIYLNPSILEKYTLSDLTKAIDTLKENGMNPKNVPLMAY